MGELSELIEYLENKYNDPVSFRSYLINTYGEINSFDNTHSDYEENEIDLYDEKEKTNSEVSEEETESVQENWEVCNEKETDFRVERVYLTFKCDEDVNLGVIKQLLKTIKIYEKQVFDKQKDEVAGKLVKNYVKELKKMEDGKNLDESEKLADKYTKILKKTLMKLWGNKHFSNIIRQYLDDNVIYVEEYEIGHRLTDDEFELLDEQLTGAMGVETYNPTNKYKVIEMVEPIIKIYYEDEDGEFDYKYISGSCKFYK